MKNEVGLPVEDGDDEFYDNCPTLGQNSKNSMDLDLTEQELLAALMTCEDSAPGSDGVPYSVYKNRFFGQVQRLMFDVVKFWSSSNIKVCSCQFFLVKF